VGKMEKVITIMAKNNIVPPRSFIVGNHSDTEETLSATIGFIEKI